MEKTSRTLSAMVLAVFALLFGLALLLGGAQPEHLSYCVAFALGVVGVGLYALFQRSPRPSPGFWERLGSRRTALLLLSFCFLVNLAWVLHFRLEPSRDHAVFWRTAVELAAGEPLSDRATIAMFPHFLGYSAFLSLFLRLFGTGPLVAPVLNVCLTTLSGFFLYRLALRWRGQNSAALALLFWTLVPSKIFFNAMVLSEPYYTCLVLGALWLTAEAEAVRPRPLSAALMGLLAGLLLGLAQTARPIAAAAVLALLLWLLFLRGERGKELRRAWFAFCALLLAAWLVTGLLWNAAAAGTLGEEPAALSGYSLYAGLNPASLGTNSAEDMDAMQELLEREGSAAAAQREMLQYARERLRSGTVPFGRLLVSKLRSFLGCDEGGAYLSRAGLRDRAYQLLALYSNVWYYAVGMLALWGAWRLFRSGERRTILLIPLYIIGLTLAQLLTEVGARSHYSILPMLILLAVFSYTRPVRRTQSVTPPEERSTP